MERYAPLEERNADHYVIGPNECFEYRSVTFEVNERESKGMTTMHQVGAHTSLGAVERKQRAATGQQHVSAKAGSFRQDNHRRYCTLECLRGLANGGVLDRVCPNVNDHGKSKHVLTVQSFIKRLQRQLSETVNADCEVLGIHGSRGTLLKVTLSSHGYTVPAKCTVPEFRDYLRHEAAAYNSLRPIQGIYVPLHLGSIDPIHPYSYDGIAYLEHMMLLSPGGLPLDLAFRDLDRTSLISQVETVPISES